MNLGIILAGLNTDEEARRALSRIQGFLTPILSGMEQPTNHSKNRVNCLFLCDGSSTSDKISESIQCWPIREYGVDIHLHKINVQVSGNYLNPTVPLEDYAQHILTYVSDMAVDILLFYGNAAGKHLGCITGALNQSCCYTDAAELTWKDGAYLIRRKVYSTYADGVFTVKPQSRRAVCIININGTAADLQESRWKDEQACSVTEVHWQLTAKRQLLAREQKAVCGDLSKAKTVFIGGKGLRTKENYERLQGIAAKFGAACGCTRPVALSGWVDYSSVVGISGNTLKADLCITFGVSGAAPLIYGLSQVKRLIAINKDKDAPVFLYANEGMEDDCIKMIDILEQLGG